MATNSATEALLKAARDAESAADDMAKSFNEASASVNRVKQGFNGLGTGSVQFFTAMTDGQKGMSKYSAGMESAASGISSFLSLLGPIGMLAGALVQGFAALSSAVFKSNDTVLEVYDIFADFGGATTLTGDALATLREKNSAAIKNFNNLAKVTGSLSGNLIALGNTAGEGINAFINIANVSDDTIKEFSKLGWSQEKLTSVQANYIKTQGYLGTLRGKDENTLRTESLKFAKQLIEYSALTGKTTDELQNIQQEAQSDYKYASAMRELAQKGDTASVKAFDALNMRVASNFGPGYAAGLRDLIANKGVATTDAGRRLLLTTGGEINAVLDKFAKTKNIDEVEVNLQRLGARLEDSLGPAARATKGLEDAALFSESLTSQGKNFYDGRTAAVEQDIKNKNLQKDSIVDTRAELEKTTKNLNQAFAAFVNLISGPVNAAFQGLLKGITFLTEALTSSWIGKKLGFTSSLTDFSMKPLAELTKLQSENAVEIAKKEKELSEAPKVTIGNTTDYANPTYTNKLTDTIRDLKNSQNLIALELSNRKNTSGTPAPAAGSPAAAPAAGKSEASSGPTDAASLARKLRGYRTGGIFNGPGTGYTVTDTDPMTSSLPKAVIPLPSGQEIPVSFKDLPKDLINKEQNLLSRSDDIGSILSEYMKAFIGSETPTTETMMPSMNNAVNMNDVLALVSEKMDNLISKMNQNAEVQNDLLILAKR